MVSWWIIVIVGVPPLMGKLSRFWFRPILSRPNAMLVKSD